MPRQVITAGMLDDLRREGRQITIDRDALLTPAARDWLKEHALPVTWSDKGSNSGAPGAAKFGLILDESQPLQRSIAMGLERDFGRAERIDPGRDTAGLAAAVGKLSQAIQRSQLSHGVVLTDCGALAACLANKRKGIRAAVVSSLNCADEVIRLLGINVLAIETQQAPYHQIRQTVGRFLRSSGAADETVATAIAHAEAGTT